MTEGRVIGLISGKGGVGKTSLTVNIGIGLKKLGRKVTLVDSDFSASNLDVYLGKYDHPVKMQQVLHEEASLERATFRHPSGVKVIASSSEINQTEPDTSKIKQVLNEARKESEFVLVDCPPGLNSTVEAIMEACDELIIVTMPTQTAGVNAAQIIEKAKQLQKPVLGTILNKVQNDPDKELVEREVEMMTETHLLGKVPYDPAMKESLFENKPLIQYKELSPASLELQELAADLAGEQYEKPKFAELKYKLNNFKEKIKS